MILLSGKDFPGELYEKIVSDMATSLAKEEIDVSEVISSATVKITEAGWLDIYPLDDTDMEFLTNQIYEDAVKRALG